MKPFVSVIIPAHNEQDYISHCLQSLESQDYGKDNYEVIVVDNSSTDSTAEIVKSFPSVQYHFKKDGPVGAVRNFGVAHSKGEYLAFLDADCIAPGNWISTGVTNLLNRKLGAIGGKSEVDQQANWVEKFWLLGNRQESSTSLGLIGCTIFIEKEKFHLVNGFDETITSGEDTKLGDDLRNKNLIVEINQSLNVVHLGNAKTVGEFIKRQAWHSENYLTDIQESIKDPTFILVVAFLVFLLATPLLLGSGKPTTATQTALTALILPNILTIKRIARSRSPKTNIKNYHKAYTLDFLYLVGRVIGLARGGGRLLKREPAASR